MDTKIIVSNRIHSKIYLFEGRRIILDEDLAELYGVTPKNLNQSVKRNKERFPADFMIQLERKDVISLKNENLKTSGRGKYSKYSSYAFTEQGVAMLSSVLRSKRAIQVNIEIMRTFTRLREFLLTNEELRKKIEELENKFDAKFTIVFDAIKELIEFKRIEGGRPRE